MFRQIPYVGSFQRGFHIRKGDPLGTCWRYIARIGTIDSLTRIAAQRGHDASLAKKASLRIRQAIELRTASTGTSELTRPLLLYYSALNLTRGIMLAYMGEAGRSHGLQFFGDRDLLRCSATVSTKGTFGLFARSVDSTLDLTGKALSLRDLISLLPELRHDFPLLKSGRPSVVAVKIVAWIQGDMFLRFLSPDYLREEFDARWSEMFFWFKDICELDPNTPFTLRVKEKPLNETAIGDFCRKYLFGELEWRPDAVWYDHIARDNVPLVKRLPAYLAALFILSNVVRYEPELVEPPSLDSTDLGYVITELLNSAERYFPQLVLELVMGQPWFFE